MFPLVRYLHDKNKVIFVSIIVLQEYIIGWLPKSGISTFFCRVIEEELQLIYTKMLKNLRNFSKDHGQESNSQEPLGCPYC